VPELVFGHDAEVAAWVIERIPHVTDLGLCAAIGVVTRSGLIAGVVYHDFQPACGNVQISMAATSPLWARRSVIAGLLSYPFRQLGCWSVHALVLNGSTHALKTFEHVGFSRKTVIPHAFGKRKHAVFCQMTEPQFTRRYEVQDG
jgi:hypothetical protein